MKKYLWLGIMLIVIGTISVYWLADKGMIQIDALLTQGAVSLGQLVGWTTQQTSSEKSESSSNASAQKAAKSPAPFPLPAKDLPPSPALPKEAFLAPVANEPIEVIRVEGFNPEISRTIVTHLIPKDLMYPPKIVLKGDKERDTQVVLTEYQPDGNPISQEIQEVPSVPFESWKGKLENMKRAPSIVPLMPYAVPRAENPGMDNTAPKAKFKPNHPVPIGRKEVKQPRKIPFMPYAQ